MGKMAKPAPIPKVDFTTDMAEIANRIEARRTIKPTLPAQPPRPDATVTSINVKALEKAQAEQETFIKNLKDKIKTPLESYAEDMQKVREAIANKAISPADFKKAEALVRKDAGFGETKLAGASDLSSREGYSTLVSQMSARGNDVGNRLAEQNVKNGREQTAQLKILNNKLGASKEPTIPATMKV